jgi:hypothetical protein
VKHGVPFDIAFSLPDDERTAWVVVLGELDGSRYDFATRTWSGPAGATRR